MCDPMNPAPPVTRTFIAAAPRCEPVSDRTPDQAEHGDDAPDDGKDEEQVAPVRQGHVARVVGLLALAEQQGSATRRTAPLTISPPRTGGR